MASIILVDERGGICQKLSVLPDTNVPERRISYNNFFVVNDEHEGKSKIIKHGTAEVIMTFSNYPRGYSIDLVGANAGEVKALLHKVREIVGYTEEYLMPFGITAQNTTFLQRMLWLCFGIVPKTN